MRRRRSTTRRVAKATTVKKAEKHATQMFKYKKKSPLKKEEPAKPICQWAHCTPCTCDTCGQTTHQIDRDSEVGKQEYLLWVQSHEDDEGVMVCHGHECYPCYADRRPRKISQKELNEKMEQYPEVKVNVLGARRDRMRHKATQGGYHKCKDLDVNVMIAATQKKCPDR